MKHLFYPCLVLASMLGFLSCEKPAEPPFLGQFSYTRIIQTDVPDRDTLYLDTVNHLYYVQIALGQNEVVTSADFDYHPLPEVGQTEKLTVNVSGGYVPGDSVWFKTFAVGSHPLEDDQRPIELVVKKGLFKKRKGNTKYSNAIEKLLGQNTP
ncbi:MAG: hypothetical protein JJ975_16290 [Bacteroidia bacterium]|nr:hypothetical protein [Bacteroidia bacterium]